MDSILTMGRNSHTSRAPGAQLTEQEVDRKDPAPFLLQPPSLPLLPPVGREMEWLQLQWHLLSPNPNIVELSLERRVWS